jgi:hypothetical protein
MKDLLEQISRKEGIELLPPISEAAMDSFEARAGFQLTPELRQLYQICGGLRRNEWEVYIMPFEAACDYALILQEVRPAIWHYFPILDAESNPICVCCGDAMRGYVVQVNHDDVARLRYRSIEDFLAAELADDEPRNWPPHTSNDIETARRLIYLTRNLPDDEDVARGDAFRFAFTLFSEDQLDEMAPFIDYPDEYVTGDLKKRLNNMAHPKAKQILQDARDSMRQFMEQAVEHLTQAGLPPAQVDFERRSIRLEPGPIYLNVPAFYAMRHQPDFWVYFVEQARFLVEYPKFVTQCLEYLEQAGLEAYYVSYHDTIYIGGSRRLKLDLRKLYEARHRPDFVTYFVEQAQHIINQAKN